MTVIWGKISWNGDLGGSYIQVQEKPSRMFIQVRPFAKLNEAFLAYMNPHGKMDVQPPIMLHLLV